MKMPGRFPALSELMNKLLARRIRGARTAMEQHATDNSLAVLRAAIGQDSALDPIALLASANEGCGAQYAVLCDTPNGSEIFYVARAGTGECTLRSRRQLLHTDQTADGAWHKLKKSDPAEKILETIHTAFDEQLISLGVDNTFVLGWQEAEGTNYALLCRIRPDPDAPPSDIALVILHVDAAGGMSVIDRQEIELT